MTDPNTASLKRVINHWLPIIVNSKYLFVKDNRFGGISLFHALFYHRKLYGIIAKPVLKYHKKYISQNYKSIFDFFCGKLVLNFRGGKFYLSIYGVFRDDEKNWPSSVILCTSLSEDGCYYESHAEEWKVSYLNDVLFEDHRTVDWSKILPYVQQHNIGNDDALTIYYKFKVFFEDKKSETYFRVESDVQIFEHKSLDLMKFGKFYELQFVIAESMRELSLLKLKKYLQTQKADTIHLALYCGGKMTEKQKIGKIENTSEISYLSFLFCKLHILRVIEHPNISDEHINKWLNNLFDVEVKLVNQKLYASVEYSSEMRALSPPSYYCMFGFQQRRRIRKEGNSDGRRLKLNVTSMNKIQTLNFNSLALILD